MYSSLIGMVEKAQRYAQERDRVSFSQFTASIRGEHDSYSVTYHDGAWHCSCDHFINHQLCSHTMAMERLLDGLIPADSTSQD
jgi:hypothetical protein